MKLEYMKAPVFEINYNSFSLSIINLHLMFHNKTIHRYETMVIRFQHLEYKNKTFYMKLK